MMNDRNLSADETRQFIKYIEHTATSFKADPNNQPRFDVASADKSTALSMATATKVAGFVNQNIQAYQQSASSPQSDTITPA